MFRFSMVAALAVGAAIFVSAPAEAAQASKPPAGGRVPMHPSQLTLGGKAHRQARRHNYVHDTLHQRTPIHGTMQGRRI